MTKKTKDTLWLIAAIILWVPVSTWIVLSCAGGGN
jgi:hypothetical protein